MRQAIKAYDKQIGTHMVPVFAHACCWVMKPLWLQQGPGVASVLRMVAKHDWKARNNLCVTASEFVRFLLQNGPVINLERRLKADALIHTATQLCSLSARSDHLWPESPDPALSLVSFLFFLLSSSCFCSSCCSFLSQSPAWCSANLAPCLRSTICWDL